ncbi:MAG: hypothetical protein JXR31_12835, partial [Prolixibacteraceae bacterium]|nr:hypothetical protein [Prolixibacteraceae bacterium]
PVEGFLEPGLGYADAGPGENFIRIGVGIIEKPEETNFSFRKSYKIVDHGKWTTDSGEGWICFTHKIKSDFGYAYIYTKTIELKSNGFFIKHKLLNTGEKAIETDQFNHNFFMIDGETSGPAFKISFPYPVSTESNLGGLLKIEGKNLNFIKEVKDTNIFVLIKGYTDSIADHKVKVINQKSGAGVTFSVDKPLYRMAFWTCETTLCPENSIWISVEPGKEMEWTSDYTLFVE